MKLGRLILRLRFYTGIVLFGVPFLTFVALFAVGHCHSAYLLFTDQPQPGGTKDPIVFRFRIDTKIEGDEYFVKFPRSGNENYVAFPEPRKFQKVTKTSFYRAIENEKRIIRNSYIFASFFFSFLVGGSLIGSTEKYRVYFRDSGCNSESLRSLKALAKERRTTF